MLVTISTAFVGTRLASDIKSLWRTPYDCSLAKIESGCKKCASWVHERNKGDESRRAFQIDAGTERLQSPVGFGTGKHKQSNKRSTTIGVKYSLYGQVHASLWANIGTYIVVFAADEPRLSNLLIGATNARALLLPVSTCSQKSEWQ